MLTDALSEPDVVGVNVTEIVQLDEAAIVAGRFPQVLVSPKEVAFVPATAIALMTNEVEPVLVRVTVWAVAELPTVVLAKVSDEGLRVTVGAAVTLTANEVVLEAKFTSPL